MPSIQCCRHFAALSVVLIATIVTTARAEDSANPSSEIERELIAVLRSDAAGGEKAIACKQLAIHGSSRAVPALAQLLPDSQLSSWARIALEAIPDPAVDLALRDATNSLDGLLLVGTINSIGVRRDADADDMLIARLKDSNPEVASAAAVALGRIATPAASDALSQFLSAAPDSVRSSIAEGCILCAEQLMGDGKMTEAAKLYDQVRVADVPKQRIVEATRGAILSRGKNGVMLLAEQLRSPDVKLFQVGLGTARELASQKVDQALALELVNATPGRGALIVQAMADRPETVILPAIAEAALVGAQPVRVAAIKALSSVGDATSIDLLIKIALGEDVLLANTAKDSLALLQEDSVDSSIQALLSGASTSDLPVLLELVGRRRINAKNALLEALGHSNQPVRHAALIALGQTISLEELPLLISQVVSNNDSEDRRIAQQALLAASVRMPDSEACAAELSTAMDRAESSQAKGELLRIVGQVGGSKALQTVAAAAGSEDSTLQDISSQLLGKWKTADAAPVLLELAASAKATKYHVRAIRGYIRIARQFRLAPAQRSEMCQSAIDASRRPAEQRMVLEVLKRFPNTENLKTAIRAMLIPELSEEATSIALAIAQTMEERGEQDARHLLAEAADGVLTLTIVKAEYGSAVGPRDVTPLVRKYSANLPMVVLESPDYDSSLGGDPAPGATKRLTIQYEINGKPGSASFAEDAPVTLPVP